MIWHLTLCYFVNMEYVYTSAIHKYSFVFACVCIKTPIFCIYEKMAKPGLISYMTFPYMAPSQYPERRLFVRSRKVSKLRDWYFKLSYRFEIWQAHRQHCCRSACQMSERSDNSKCKSRGFETWRDLTERRLFRYWDGAQQPNPI